jgi:Siphovirus Gp157
MSAPSLSLHARFEEVELIASTLEQLDDEQLDCELREELRIDLVAKIAGTREKIDNTNAVLSMFDTAEMHAAREIDRLTERILRIQKQRMRLENYVINVFESAGITKAEGFTSTLATKRNPAAVVVDSQESIPAEYMRTPEPKPQPVPVPVPDKKLIAAALKNHIAVPGCHLAQTIRLERS